MGQPGEWDKILRTSFLENNRTKLFFKFISTIYLDQTTGVAINSNWTISAHTEIAFYLRQ